MVYGDSITPQMLVDGNGQPVAMVVQSCDSWWLGGDADGVGVILDSETGRILSHGTVHPGLDMSQLPDHLPPPFTLR